MPSFHARWRRSTTQAHPPPAHPPTHPRTPQQSPHLSARDGDKAVMLVRLHANRLEAHEEHGHARNGQGGQGNLEPQRPAQGASTVQRGRSRTPSGALGGYEKLTVVSDILGAGADARHAVVPPTGRAPSCCLDQPRLPVCEPRDAGSNSRVTPQIRITRWFSACEGAARSAFLGRIARPQQFHVRPDFSWNEPTRGGRCRSGVGCDG